MSFFPGNHGAVYFEKDALLWRVRGEEDRRVRWSRISSVTTGDEGATIHSDCEPLLIPTDVVWYEFVVEDIISEARRHNPNYKGPVPVSKPRDLRIPKDNQEQHNYTRRAQRFYKDRCPNYQEFKAFLEANLEWEFTENSYYACSMSMCSGSPVDEGYSTDLVVPKSESWYRKFEKLAPRGSYTGAQLLEVLKGIEP